VSAFDVTLEVRERERTDREAVAERPPEVAEMDRDRLERIGLDGERVVGHVPPGELCERDTGGRWAGVILGVEEVCPQLGVLGGGEPPAFEVVHVGLEPLLRGLGLAAVGAGQVESVLHAVAAEYQAQVPAPLFEPGHGVFPRAAVGPPGLSAPQSAPNPRGRLVRFAVTSAGDRT
jgi:hypothetical protein